MATLRQLAQLYGIQTAYYDVFHRRRQASAESLLEALRALGAPVNNFHHIADALRERRQEIWRRALEPVITVWDGELPEVDLRLEAERASSRRVECRVKLESGEERSWVFDLGELPAGSAVQLEGARYVSKKIALPTKLPWGYHRLRVEFQGGGGESLVIAAPLRAHDRATRAWGLFLPIYSLHSQASWGAGDFSDLEALEKWVMELGGGVISTLPFLASFLEEPFDASPYAPASRLFWNEFYVDPRKAEEFADCAAARQLVQSSEFQREMEALRSAPLVHYRRQMALKRRVLGELARWLVREKPQRYAAFCHYVDSHPSVEDYAAFRAATERYCAPWTEWPEPLRSGVLKEGDYDEDAKLYHLYGQWLAAERVSALAEKARRSGPGLYLDFPLGVHPHSYDVWREREVFALEASAGAPPDSVFIGGQNWAFPPLHPEAIRRKGYGYLIACLRHQLTHAGLMRIDHVMGLHRLFWIPRGLEVQDGVYVRYRAEEFYAILSLESHRYSALVVGENLGTVPHYVNAAMSRHGVQKMCVVEYELRPDRDRPLRAVPSDSVASLNTHDMPPFAAFLQGLDFEDRLQLGLLKEEEAQKERSVRRAIRRALAAFLYRKDLLTAESEQQGHLLSGCLQWLAAGPAKVVIVNLEDLWLETEPQNVPGTGAEWPNWRRKARYALEEFSKMSAVVETLQNLSTLRKRGGVPSR